MKTMYGFLIVWSWYPVMPFMNRAAAVAPVISRSLPDFRNPVSIANASDDRCSLWSGGQIRIVTESGTFLNHHSVHHLEVSPSRARGLLGLHSILIRDRRLVYVTTPIWPVTPSSRVLCDCRPDVQP